MSVRIRKFTMDDYEAVISIWKACNLPYKPNGRDSRKSIENEIDKGIAGFFVAETASKIIATVLATHDGRKGWINRLAVLPAYRKSGLARKLVEMAEEELHNAGISIIACLIEDGNQVSLDVFSKLGYINFIGMHYLTKRKHPDV